MVEVAAAEVGSFPDSEMLSEAACQTRFIIPSILGWQWDPVLRPMGPCPFAKLKELLAMGSVSLTLC